MVRSRSLSPTEWSAIRWYMEQHDLTIRDLMKGPIIVFRDKHDDLYEINISDIKMQYDHRKDK